MGEVVLDFFTFSHDFLHTETRLSLLELLMPYRKLSKQVQQLGNPSVPHNLS